jgi:hypothetical protein
MSAFSFPPDQVSTLFEAQRRPVKGKATRSQQRAAKQPFALVAANEQGADLSNQFVVVQFNNQADGDSFIESSAVDPGIVGSPQEPDLLVALELRSFQLGAVEPSLLAARGRAPQAPRQSSAPPDIL